MTDPYTLMQQIDTDAAGLDTISKNLHTATEELIEAEEAWDALYDAVAESLKDDMAKEDRKGDPAEHTITSVTRRQHRAEYQRVRRAKRKLEQAERQLQAKRAAINGRQSELAALRDELKATDHGTQGGPIHGGSTAQPQWSNRDAA